MALSVDVRRPTRSGRLRTKEKRTGSRKNIVWISSLRAFATFMVILLHCASPLVQQSEFASSSWWIAHLYDALMRACVPLFVMISGALLFSKTMDLSTFLSRRFQRILLPFLFWAAIYLVVQHVILESNASLSWIMLSVVRGPVSFHFWFIYMLLGLYLFIPILNSWVVQANAKHMLYFLAIWGFTLLLKPVIAIDPRLAPGLTLDYFGGFMGYLVLGFYLYRYGHKYSSGVVPGMLLFALGAAITIAGPYYSGHISGEVDFLLYNYLTPNVAIMAIGLFLLFKNTTLPGRDNRFIGLVSNHSYGIYLVHILVLRYLFPAIGFDPISLSPLFGIPVMAIACLLVSLLTIMALKRLPFAQSFAG